MSMIDYDARPVTPQIVLVGHRASAVGYRIRDFLSRNGVPYEWVDVDDTGRVAELLTVEETDPDQLERFRSWASRLEYSSPLR